MADIFQQPYYRFNKFFLCCAGLWPSQSRAKRFLLRAFMLSISTVQMIAHIRVVVKFWNFDVITVTTPVLVVFLSTAISVLVAIVNSKENLNLLQRIEIDWIFVAEQPEMHILRGYAADGKQFTIVFSVGLGLTTILYMIQPFLPGFQEVMDFSNETTSKSLPLPADYFGLDVDVYYYYMLAYMAMFYVYGVLVAVSVETMFVMLVQHACGMFTVVGHQLQRMANDITEEFANLNSQPKLEPVFQHFIACIKKHNDVIEFCKTLEAVTTWIFLPVLGISVVGIGVIGFQISILMEKNPKGALRYVAFLIAIISHQFVMSMFSQKLIDHTKRISEYVYQSEWYRTSLATQKLLILVTMRAQVPCEITAGKIITMSLENFAMALKTSISYFAVMRSMQ